MTAIGPDYYAITEHYYYTVLIPYSVRPTVWHPTEPTGPFRVLCRGAFRTEPEADAWARESLQGQPYSVRRDDWTDIDWE